MVALVCVAGCGLNDLVVFVLLVIVDACLSGFGVLVLHLMCWVCIWWCLLVVGVSCFVVVMFC